MELHFQTQVVGVDCIHSSTSYVVISVQQMVNNMKSNHSSIQSNRALLQIQLSITDYQVGYQTRCCLYDVLSNQMKQVLAYIDESNFYNLQNSNEYHCSSEQLQLGSLYNLQRDILEQGNRRADQKLFRRSLHSSLIFTRTYIQQVVQYPQLLYIVQHQQLPYSPCLQ
ncbi:Hypothetical_protein [Hexamita inflata]|uniref:Hypothetical_protein n=1 Tax=Hexamita inflata TaxID=28002 RepID=A0ABP1HEA0_9EUKA